MLWQTNYSLARLIQFSLLKAILRLIYSTIFVLVSSLISTAALVVCCWLLLQSHKRKTQMKERRSYSPHTLSDLIYKFYCKSFWFCQVVFRLITSTGGSRSSLLSIPHASLPIQRNLRLLKFSSTENIRSTGVIN